MKIWLKFFILATWLPILFDESCGDSPKVDNSIASSWGADEGKQVTYACADGYRLSGEKNLYCTSSQEWQAPPPICKAVSSRESEPDEEEESEALVTEKITQTISTAVHGDPWVQDRLDGKVRDTISSFSNQIDLSALCRLLTNPSEENVT
ncbi:unnamed protein product [Caretta caretta]